jgi:hypothetical protein
VSKTAVFIAIKEEEKEEIGGDRRREERRGWIVERRQHITIHNDQGIY